MRQPSLLRRYILFFCGVLCAALGIALITLAGMGTSAVSSLSYVLTFVFPGLSLGVFTFLVNCTMLVGQVLLLRHRFQSIQLLQIPATLLFSVCIDLWTELLAPLVPESYGARFADSLNEAMDNQYHYVYDRSQRREKRDAKEIGISAVRGGSIVGEHEVIFAGPDEVIEFKHTAYSKAVFGKGAVEAAKYLAGKPAGRYDMSNVIEG